MIVFLIFPSSIGKRNKDVDAAVKKKSKQSPKKDHLRAPISNLYYESMFPLQVLNKRNALPALKQERNGDITFPQSYLTD